MGSQPHSSTTWIVNTRARAQADEFTRLLESSGFSVLEFPCLQLLAESTTELCDELRKCAGPGSWLLFTSANAVSAFPAELNIGDMKVACLAEKTAQAARDRGFSVEFVGTGGTAESFAYELLAAWGAGAVGLQVVVVRGDIAAPELAALIAARGVAVHEVVAYRSVLPEVEPQTSERLAAALRAGDRILLTFSSSQAIRNWRVLSGAIAELQPWNQLLLAVPLVVIGPKTAETAAKLGFSHITTAAGPTIEAMLKAIRDEVHSE